VERGASLLGLATALILARTSVQGVCKHPRDGMKVDMCIVVFFHGAAESRATMLEEVCL